MRCGARGVGAAGAWARCGHYVGMAGTHTRRGYPGLMQVGPEYTALISEYAETAWRPDTAAIAAPSLARLLRQVDDLTARGIWT